MSTLLIARSKRVALAATFLIPFAGAALAQTADNRSTADIEKENAALRAKVHRLEAEKENANLRAKVDQLQGRRPAQAASQTAATETAQGAPQQLVTRIQTNSPDRTLVMADLPVKAAPIPPAYYSWTGFYLGGNIGYSVGSDRARPSLATGTGDAVETVPFDTAVTPAGAIGGAQIGYNWQGGPNWLFGFEADFQGSDQKATSCILTCVNAPGAGQLSQTTVTHNLDYFGTARGRFGFVDRGALFYVTGGAAFGHVNQEVDTRFINTNANQTAIFINSAATSENKFGWVVGAGAEASLGGNWTAKVEYLYMDLGSITTVASGIAPPGVTQTAETLTVGATSKIHDNIIRAGLNYRFGPPAGPVSAYDAMAAVPPAIYNWTGFYVGANAGYGFGNDRHQLDANEPPFGTITSDPGTSVTPKGGLGGVQVGYNWQAAPRWLVGFEADIQGTAQKDTVCTSLVCFLQSNNSGGTERDFIAVTHQIDYFGTFRGRIGYVFNNTLFYATGGAAFGHVRETLDQTFVVQSQFQQTAQFTNQTTTKDLTGYVVGGGIETMLAGAWSVKAEYLYMNLGSLSQSMDASTPNAPLTLISNSSFHDHIVRAGINYHIGAAPY